MSYEILVGLNVVDDKKYQQYREKIAPILCQYQAKFIYDFRVSDVLDSPVDSDINRVFILNFSNEAMCDAFFKDGEYLRIKEQYFVESVASTSNISRYEVVD